MHTDGRIVATPILQRAATAVAQMPVEDVLRWGWMAPVASHATWDSDGSTAIFERQAQIVRDAGALAELPVYLSSLALDKVWNGDFAGAGLLDRGERHAWRRRPGVNSLRSRRFGFFRCKGGKLRPPP